MRGDMLSIRGGLVDRVRYCEDKLSKTQGQVNGMGYSRDRLNITWGISRQNWR